MASTKTPQAEEQAPRWGRPFRIPGTIRQNPKPCEGGSISREIASTVHTLNLLIQRAATEIGEEPETVAETLGIVLPDQMKLHGKLREIQKAIQDRTIDVPTTSGLEAPETLG